MVETLAQEFRNIVSGRALLELELSQVDWVKLRGRIKQDQIALRAKVNQSDVSNFERHVFERVSDNALLKLLNTYASLESSDGTDRSSQVRNSHCP